jgi:hypothetical protein
MDVIAVLRRTLLTCTSLVMLGSSAQVWADSASDLPPLPHLAPANRTSPQQAPSAPLVASVNLANAGTWLIGQQVTSGPTSGALPWTPGDVNVYANTQGATAEGLLRIYKLTGNPALLNAAIANGQCQITNCVPGFTYPGNGTHRFATHDPLFLIEISQFSGDPQYAQFVTDHFWTPLANATYGDTGDNLDAAGFAAYDLSRRASQGIPELAAWDLSKLVVAAHEAGQTAAEQAFMNGVLASLNAADATHNNYDVIGLTGAIWASAVSGIDLDPTTGTWAADNSTNGLAASLLTFQASGGGFIGATTLAVNDANADNQTTGYAMLALSTLSRSTYIAQIRAAANYVASLQQGNGEIVEFTGATGTEAGSVESHGEALEAFADTVAGVDRWVNTTGGIDTGDCSIQASPCQTIAYAISQAGPGNTIHIASGTYDLLSGPPLTITKDGLRLVGEGPSKPNIQRSSGGINQTLLVISGAKNVAVQNLHFAMDQTFIAEGVIANGFVDGLSIDNNDFVDLQSNAGASSKYSWRNAISINDNNGNSQGIGTTIGSSVSVTNNSISGLADAANGVFLRCGIDMDNGVGTISGNTIVAGVHDIRVRFSTVTGNSSGATTTISGNTISGRGLELDNPNSGVGPVTISNNHINAIAGIDDTTQYAADWSLVRLMDNPSNIPVTLSANVFAGYTGTYRGVLVGNFPNVTFTNNTFTPASGASDFVSLVLSNKALNTDVPPDVPLPITLTATGNTFNGSGVAGTGRAVEFLDDNDADGTAQFGAINFGDGTVPGANNFDGNLRWYFHLDDYTCETASTCTAPPLPDYTGDIGNAAGTNTQVRPFTGNVSAAVNNFAGVQPASMNASQQNLLQAQTYDKSANPGLGEVDYGLTETQSVVYVDATYSGQSFGTSLAFPFSNPNGACAATTAYFGINAFATIADGLMHVTNAGTVCIAKSNYAEAVNITNNVQMIGDGNTAGDTVIAGAVTLNASGLVGAPLLLQNLRVTNAAGKGVAVGTASHLAFYGVAFAGNGDAGLDFDSVIDDVAISGSLFDANIGAGIRMATAAQVSNVTINADTVFSNNAAGIILFGASASGNGQISNWTIDSSRFLSNDNADASGFGGGIWLKTGGAGSAINGFTVTNSMFADNGSSNTLNQVGITVRARPGTTMTGVNICNNTFEETAAPGTQLTGINVFDDTGNTGYQMIAVCASNTFSGLGHSISGLEQHNSRGTQPVVNITGGAIANTEYINTPVIRVRDNAQFATIGQAMNDAGTTAGDEIHAPAGFYRENVTVTHNGMTLSGDGASTVIDGVGLSGSGVTIPNAETGVTLHDFTVQNFTAIGTSSGACIYGALSNSDTAIRNTTVANCAGGRGGIFLSAGAAIDNVTIDNNDVSQTDGRGIVIWDGQKTHIAITNNHVHDLTGCCGIELQDGSASGVTVTGNTVENTGDSGVAFVQLTSGAGPNLISGNTIVNTGRFGMEVKIPNGTGLASGDGSIVVENNTVTAGATAANMDDRAGIAVVRRSYSPAYPFEVDATNGVIVRNNMVNGWQPVSGSPNDGFGIVVEGTNSQVYGNTVNGNGIGIQLQSGNDPGSLPGDSDQNATDAFFSRGNAPASCVDLGSNTFNGNGTDSRSETNPSGINIAADVHDTTNGTFFCSIQSAIDAATTSPGDTLVADPGTYAENVVVDKSVTLQGPFAGVPGYDGSRDGTGEGTISPATGVALTLAASNAVIDGFSISIPSGVAVQPGGAARDNMQFINNRVVNIPNGVGIRFEPGEGTPAIGFAISDNLFADIAGTGTNGTAIELYKGTRNATVSDNHFDSVQQIALQANGGNGTVQGLSATGNVVRDPDAVGANNAFVITKVSNAVMQGNDLQGVKTGLFISDAESSLAFTCNSISGANRGISTLDFFGNMPNSGVRIFDNSILGSASADVNNGMTQALVVGSNYYGGGNAVVTGSNAFVADGLPANPIGNAACGDNTPTQIVVRSGSGQFALITNSFANPLVGRLEDALGGAVMGESMQFTPPGSGASANLANPSGLSDFNGLFSTTAIANSVAGPYAVTLASGSLAPASFMLTNNPATASIVLNAATLNATFDGTVHAVTATTTPAGLTYTVTYDGSSTAPTNAGTYNVVATIDDPSYSGSTSGTLTIAPKPETLALSNLSQVYDGNPKSVTVVVSPDPSVAYAVTYNGSATAPTAVGTYSVVATVSDPNYTGTASATLTITAASAPDISVSISNGRSYVQYGKTLTNTIVVQNIGTADASSVIVAAVLPVTLVNGNWTCVGYTGATCGAASGSGDLGDMAVVPQNGVLVYTFTATVNDDQSLATDQVAVTATATVNGTPADSNPANDTATTPVTQIVIFRDGFEAGGDGAQNAAATTPLSSMGAKSMLSLDTAAAPQGQFVPQSWLRGVDANGRTVFVVDALRIGTLSLMRLSVSDASENLVPGAWVEAQQFALGFAGSSGGYQAMLATGKGNVQMPLPAWAALPVQVYAAH